MCRGAHPDHSTFLVTYFFHFFVVSLYLCILAVLCFLLRRLFSSCGQQGLISSCGLQASQCFVFSCRRTLALEHMLSSRDARA